MAWAPSRRFQILHTSDPPDDSICSRGVYARVVELGLPPLIPLARARRAMLEFMVRGRDT
jgi:hypothetical protein